MSCAKNHYHSSFLCWPHASSNHPDPETEDIVDIYSAAITDKREWNGENGRTESVIGLLFKDGHYSEWNLNQKYDLGRQWENKNHDIRFKKLWTSETSWREKQNRNDHRKQSKKWKQTKRQIQSV